jgi:hypothetical protein
MLEMVDIAPRWWAVAWIRTDAPWDGDWGEAEVLQIALMFV